MSLQGAFCAVLVDEWVRHGIAHAVVSPGSRSTPLAVALASRTELSLHIVLDERSAAFVALGIGRATGCPAVLLCTSGTAAVGFHAAVVEGHLSGVPLLVCTADRPADLHGVGAPQTIDQVGLYGPAVVWSADVDPQSWPQRAWRSLASRSVLEAERGPVHLNLRLREPLLDDGADPAPPSRLNGRSWHQRASARSIGNDPVPEEVARCRRVLVVAGEGCDPRDAAEAVRGPWPILADPLSGWRIPGAATVAAFDAIARQARQDDGLAPDLVVHLGRPPASKALGQWLDRLPASHLLVQREDRWLDPARQADFVLAASPIQALSALVSVVAESEFGWLERWQRAEAAAQGAIADVLAGRPELTEPGIARDLVRALPSDATLFVSSSMPIRDIEWFAQPRAGVAIYANRGANGIDGVTSTALGVALARGGLPTVALLGDLTFLHDASGLNNLAGRPCSLVLVVVDNAGGGIFAFLPQAVDLSPERFEQLFGTPQAVDLQALATAHGIPCQTVETAAELIPALAEAVARGGVCLLLAHTDRQQNVEIHAQLAAAVKAAMGRY